MAKQLSFKQQMYQSLAESHVRQVMQQQNEQYMKMAQDIIAETQPTEADMQMAQNILAEFPKPEQPVQQVKSTPKQTEIIPSIADTQQIATDRNLQYRKDKRDIALSKKKREDYARQQQEEQQLAEQKHNAKGTEKWNESVNDTLDVLNSKNFKDIVKKGKANIAATEQKNKEAEENKKLEQQIANFDQYNTEAVPSLTDEQKALEEQILNSDRYVADTSKDKNWREGLLTKDQKEAAIRNTTPEMVAEWLSPDRKLTTKEKAQAREYASSEIQKYTRDANHQPINATEEEKQHYKDMVDLLNKTSGIASFAANTVKAPYNLVDLAKDASIKLAEKTGGLGAKLTDKLGLTENAQEQLANKVEEVRNTQEQKDASMRRELANANTQNPLASAAGTLTGQVAMYAATNPIFDGIAEGAGVTSNLAKFFINQGAQNAQDLALDTAPLVKQLMADGSMSDEDKREVFGNILWNAIGNAAMGGVQAIPQLAKYSADKEVARAIKNQNILEGADNLAKAAEAGPIFKDADNVLPILKNVEEPTRTIPNMEDLLKQNNVDEVVRAATEQAETAAKNIEDIAKQVPENNVPVSEIAAFEDTTRNINRVPDNINEIAKQNMDEIKNMEAVSIVKGEQFKGEGSLLDKVLSFFNSRGGKAYNPILGDVDLTRRGIKDSISHNKLTRRKVDTFASVPDVIENGKVVAYEPNWKKRNYDTALIAAPTKVQNPDGTIDDFITGVIVRRDKDTQRFYTHDAVSINRKELSLETGTPSQGQNTRGDSSFSVYSILKKLADDKFNANKISVNTSENLPKPRPGKEMPMDPAVKAEAEELIKASEAEEAERLFSQDVEDKLLYDFDNIGDSYYNNRQAIRNALENRDFAIKDAVINEFTDKNGKQVYQIVHSDSQKPIKELKSKKAAEKALAEYVEGSALKKKAIKAFEDIDGAIIKYENAAFNAADVEEVNTAKKAVEAARKRYERAMKELDPDYYDAVSSKDFADKITKPYYTRNPAAENPVDEELMDELVNDWVEQDMDNPNRFLRGTDQTEGGYKLQTFAEGDTPKEQWKTSKFRENTVEKQGWGDKLDKKDYGYRVYSEAEQKADAAAKNLSADDLIYKDQFDPSDIKQAMKLEQELYEKGDAESLRKLQRLGTKISFEAREGARIPQALAEFDRTTPEGQARFAQTAINDIVDKKVGTGTSEALDNVVEKINKAYDKFGSDKEAFSKEVEDILSKDIKNYAAGKNAKKMQSRAIRGKNKVLKMIDNGASIDEISDVIYKQNGGVKLTAQENKQIYDLLKQAKALPEGSYKQEELLARAAKIAVAKAPSTAGQKIRSILYTNMLGNFKTAFSRNAFGNLAYQTLEQGRSPIAAAVDKATSLVTGKHSTLGWNKGKTAAYGKGFAKGFKEQVSDLVKGIDTGRSGAKGWEMALANNATTYNDTKAIGKFANKVEYYVRNAMELGDRPFYEANYMQRATELRQLVDRYGKDNVAGLSGVKDADLDEVIDMIASVHAADSVFQKHGKMSKGLTDLRNGLGQMSEGVLGVDVLSTAASPFTMTPGNMIERAIEYTPLGFVKNAAETAKEVFGKQGFNQRRFVDEASRSIAGLPILYGSYKLAQHGGINGGYSTDPDEKQAQIDDGFIEYGLNVFDKIPFIGGKTLDTSDLPVYGPFMQAGAVIAEDGLTPMASLQAAEAVLGGSTTQGLRRAFGGDSAGYSSSGTLTGMIDNFKNTVLSSGSQLIPSLARQTAQTIDPYKRDLGEYGTLDYYWNLMKNSDPVGRQSLPIKTDVEGREVLQNQGRGLGSKILENYILPMNMSEYKPSALNQEASRLLDSAETAMGFVPKAARKDLRQWDEKAEKEYSEEQFRDYKKDLGTLNSEAGNALIESDFYKEKLNDKQKAQMLSDTYSAMKQIAKENATGIPADDKIATAYKEGGTEGMLNYLAGKQAAKDTGQKANSKVAQAIQEAADDGDVETAYSMSEQVKLLPDFGLDKPGPRNTYVKACGEYDNLTAEDFAKTYKAIDTDHSQGLAKKEVVAYMNNHNLSYNEGMKFWQAYAVTEGERAWKIPSLEDGVWK